MVLARDLENVFISYDPKKDHVCHILFLEISPIALSTTGESLPIRNGWNENLDCLSWRKTENIEGNAVCILRS